MNTTGAVLRVGVSGHRKLGADPRTAWYVQAQCVRILDRLQELARYRPGGGTVLAYSALAIGADQLFAQAALGLGIPVVGIIPFERYAEDFEGEDRSRFETLLGLCREVQRLPGKERSNEAYFEAGKVTVDQVEYLVGVWDGKPAAGLGGTGDVVAYAEKKGKTVLLIDPGRAIP
jgi:hypothetical protein